jgi:transcriptional regulator with XRE-family HTH domain
LKYPLLQKEVDMANIKKKLGIRLFQLRNEAGLTQAELAEKADLSIDSISRIERGERAPSLESLENIASALGVEPMECFNFNGKEIAILAEGSPGTLELWNLLKSKKRDQIKKIHDIAKILLR